MRVVYTIYSEYLPPGGKKSFKLGKVKEIFTSKLSDPVAASGKVSFRFLTSDVEEQVTSTCFRGITPLLMQPWIRAGSAKPKETLESERRGDYGWASELPRRGSLVPESQEC